jgi:putative transposase
MSRPLDDLRLAVLMLDGIELKGRCCVVALGIDVEGVKHPLGLWDGSTENATVATTLLSNLVERGPDVEQGVLVVIDGAKALRKAVRDVLGVHTPVQRCVRHKERNVLGHLPERDQPLVRRRLRAAWALENHDRALDQLRVLADELARSHPGAAASLREGMEETLTVTRLGVRGRLRLDEPVRVDDRHRSPRQPKRQALVQRRHVPALDGRGHARSRGSVPQDHRLPGPRQARRRGRARRRRQVRHRHPDHDHSHDHHDRGAGGHRFTRLR